jgi:hypothetical protein
VNKTVQTIAKVAKTYMQRDDINVQAMRSEEHSSSVVGVLRHKETKLCEGYVSLSVSDRVHASSHSFVQKFDL